MVLNDFWSYMIFGGQRAILVYHATCTWDNKLCCGL